MLKRNRGFFHLSQFSISLSNQCKALSYLNVYKRSSAKNPTRFDDTLYCFRYNVVCFGFKYIYSECFFVWKFISIFMYLFTTILQEFKMVKQDKLGKSQDKVWYKDKAKTKLWYQKFLKSSKNEEYVINNSSSSTEHIINKFKGLCILPALNCIHVHYKVHIYLKNILFIESYVNCNIV